MTRSVGRALHRHRRGHGFEPRSSLNFFRLSFQNCLSSSIEVKLLNLWVLLIGEMRHEHFSRLSSSLFDLLLSPITDCYITYFRFLHSLDCEQSLFCSKIRGEKVGEHESRASGEAASSARGDRRETSEKDLFSLVSHRARYSRLCCSRVTRDRLLSPRGFSSKRETARSLYILLLYTLLMPMYCNSKL